STAKTTPATRVRPPKVSVRRARRPCGSIKPTQGGAAPGSAWRAGSARRSGLAGQLEAVADPAHGVDVDRPIRIRLDLLAQGADVDVERALVAVEVRAPDRVEQVAAREHHT